MTRGGGAIWFWKGGHDILQIPPSPPPKKQQQTKQKQHKTKQKPENVGQSDNSLFKCLKK